MVAKAQTTASVISNAAPAAAPCSTELILFMTRSLGGGGYDLTSIRKPFCYRFVFSTRAMKQPASALRMRT